LAKSWWSVLFIGSFLSACVSNSSAPLPLSQVSAPDPAVIAAVKAERDASTKAYVRCLARAAKSLDDRKSDPRTIAEAMISACAEEFDANVKVHSRNLADGIDGEQKVARSLREGSYGSAIQLVLQSRKGTLR
jgi:hypothetical protein